MGTFSSVIRRSSSLIQFGLWFWAYMRKQIVRWPVIQVVQHVSIKDRQRQIRLILTTFFNRCWRIQYRLLGKRIASQFRPTNHFISESRKLWIRNWFSKNIRPIFLSINLSNCQFLRFHLITKMMPFNWWMSGSGSIFISVIGKDNTSSIIFSNNRGAKRC